MKVFVEALVTWIAEHSEAESAFLSPDQQFNVNATELLDFIVTQGVASEDEVQKWVDKVADAKTPKK